MDLSQGSRTIFNFDNNENKTVGDRITGSMDCNVV